MIFINVSPLLWDIIIFAIIIFGIVTGFFIGGRALTFISAGNLLSIGLNANIKPMLINSFKNMVSPWFSDFSGSFASFKNLLTDNIGFLIYAIVWIIGINILFWIIYIILYFVLFNKNKIEHKAINATAGILINFIRMSILGSIIIIMMGTSVFGNKILSYGVIKNEIPTTSVTHKIFSSIDNNLPFLNVNVTDINTVIDLYQNSETLKQSINELKNNTTYEECYSTVEKLKMIGILRVDETDKIANALKEMESTGDINANKKIIIELLQQHGVDNFLDVNYMVLVFNAYANILNLYSEVVQVFDNNLKDMPRIDTTLPKNMGRYNLLKPKISAFTNSIKDVIVREHIIQNLKNIYNPF
ncbi:hypothetical protein [Spiroplasma endosymbiont of Colias croceus]